MCWTEWVSFVSKGPRGMGTLGNSWAVNCGVLVSGFRSWGGSFRRLKVCMGTLGFPTALNHFLFLFWATVEEGSLRKSDNRLPNSTPDTAIMAAWTNGCNRVYPLNTWVLLKSHIHSVPMHSPWGYSRFEPLLAKKGVINKSGNLEPSLDKGPFSGKEIPYDECQLWGDRKSVV